MYEYEVLLKNGERTFGYEDADGMEGAATIEVNSDNPPCFCQQSIEFP